MNRARSPAVILSVGLHSVVVLTLCLAFDGGESGPARPTVIYAELLQVNASAVPSEHARTPPNADRSATPPLAGDREPTAEPQAAVTEPTPSSLPAVLPASQEPSIAGNPGLSATEIDARPEELAHPLAPPVPDLVVQEVPPDHRAAFVDERSIDPAPRIPERLPMPDFQQQALAAKFASWTGRFTADQPNPTLEWTQNGSQFTAVLRRVPADAEMGMEYLSVDISALLNGARVATQMRMKRLAFSSFAQFVDRWDSEVQIHDDEVDGRFHSNSQIRVLYDRDTKPVFHGKVTTASRRIQTDASGRVDRAAMFLGGLETGVDRIGLPPRFEPAPDGGVAAETERFHRFEHHTRITFYADGSYGWSRLGSNDPERRTTLLDGANYISAAADKELYLQGIVNGTVLVYSPERVVIEDDLIYPGYPHVAADANDYLGIVSDKSVEVAGPDVTGRGDLVINASIFAKRRFAVRNYRSRDDATLIIYGSLAAGSVSATEPRFATRIDWDPRLDYSRPPSFPLTDRYELEAWDGTWKIEPVAE